MRKPILAVALLALLTACSDNDMGFKVAPTLSLAKLNGSGNSFINPITGAPAGNSGNPTDATNLNATVVNSPSDVASWPVTTTISQVGLGSGGVSLAFSKKDGPGRWPDITPPGWSGPLQYTLWIVMSINGHWYTSGIIQYWYGLGAAGGDITQNNQIAVNWVYDSRWGPMAGHQPAPGEQVGFFVTSGNARGVSDASQSTRERSNVVLVAFPSGDQTFNF